MKKKELVASLAEAAGASKAACERVLDAMGSVVSSALVRGKSVMLPGVGKLALKQLAARTLKTPTGVEMDVPARAAVKFGAAKALKDALATDEAV